MTSGGNNFNNFPENQLTKFRGLNSIKPRKPIWWNATVLPFPLSWC